MRRFRLGLGVVVALSSAVAIVVGFGSQAGARPAQAAAARSAAYADPGGDASGGPDVTSAAVSRLANGWLRFTLRIGNRPSNIQPGDVVYVAIDTDRSSATGINVTHSSDPKKQGPDFAFTMYYPGGSSLQAGEFKLVAGRQAESLGRPGMIAAHAHAGTWWVQISAALIGNAKRFAFFVWTYSNPSSSGNLDFAPDKGEYRYPKA